MVVARGGVPYSPPNPLLACVLRAQAGEAPAFTELVRDHQHAIYSLVLGIVRNTEDAGDIVQDVWVKVARHLPQLREPERFVPWLYRIARNCSMDFCNSRKKRPQAAYRRDDEHEDDAFDVPDSSTYVPEQELLSLDERRKVWEALGALSEADRTVLFLRESRELPYAEIARILGISCNAAEVRVFRARDRFRKQFIEVEEAAPECNISPLQLGAFVDGELGDATQTMLERHIHSCAECTARLTAIESGRTLYRGLGLFLMPSGLAAGILSHLSSLGIASAATAAAGTGMVVVGSGTAATGAAASSAAATGAVTATGTVAATAAAATGAAATSTTFGASIAAAVAAVAVTSTVAVEYTEPSAAAAVLPTAAVVEIAAPPAPSVTIVYMEPALTAAQQQAAEALAVRVVVSAVSAPTSDESSSDTPGESTPTSVAGPAAGATRGNSGEGDGRGFDGQGVDHRGADAKGTGSAGAGERDRTAGAGTVIAALTKDDRSGRVVERADISAKSDRDSKGDRDSKNDGGRSGSSAVAASSSGVGSVASIAVTIEGARGNDGGRDSGRGNDGGRDSGGRDHGRDEGGRGGHDGGGRGR